jgi:Carboxypeptidase regulatory-like domain
MPSTRSIRHAGCLGLLVALATLSACDTSASPTPTPTPTPSAPASPASAAACSVEDIASSGIDGLVVDAEGNPLNDIFIQVDNLGGFSGSTRTGADGAFTAPGVTGEFVITTVDVAYDTATERITVPCGETVEVELVLTPSGG